MKTKDESLLATFQECQKQATNYCNSFWWQSPKFLHLTQRRRRGCFYTFFLFLVISFYCLFFLDNLHAHNSKHNTYTRLLHLIDGDQNDDDFYNSILGFLFFFVVVIFIINFKHFNILLFFFHLNRLVFLFFPTFDGIIIFFFLRFPLFLFGFFSCNPRQFTCNSNFIAF